MSRKIKGNNYSKKNGIYNKLLENSVELLSKRKHRLQESKTKEMWITIKTVILEDSGQEMRKDDV